MADCNTLNGGIAITCDNNVGGIRRLWLKELSKVTIAHESPSNKIGTLTVDDSSEFYEFEFTKNSSTYTEEETVSEENGNQLTVQTITLKLNRREQTKRDKLILLGKFKKLVAIIEDSNGLYHLLGETEGVVYTTNTGGPGQAKTDHNGYVITFIGSEPELASEVTEAAVNSVTS